MQCCGPESHDLDWSHTFADLHLGFDIIKEDLRLDFDQIKEDLRLDLTLQAEMSRTVLCMYIEDELQLGSVSRCPAEIALVIVNWMEHSCTER